MNYGQGIGFTSLEKASGAPFTAGSADNGLSVDTVSKKIVLGDNGSGLADLLDARSIDLVDFLIFLFSINGIGLTIDASPGNPNLRLDGDSTTTGGNTPFIYGDSATTDEGLTFFDATGAPVMSIAISNSSSGNLVGVSCRRANVVVSKTIGTLPVALGTLQVDGTIATADPGAGAAEWRLGTVRAAAVALDVTHYVETMINGVLTKLAIVT